MNDWLVRRWAPVEDWFLDHWLGVSTRAFLPAASLGVGFTSREHGNPYHACWYRNIRTLLMWAKEIGWCADSFVDLGCGEGRAVFYAASTGFFKRVIGVEYDLGLIAHAEENAQEFHASSTVEFLHQDAAQTTLPEGCSVVFMFNPFQREVLQGFLAHNRGVRGQFIIAYANDVLRDVLSESGWKPIRRDPHRKISLWVINQ